MTTVRRVRLLFVAVLAGAFSLCYLGAMLVTLHGPFEDIWLFVVLALPVVSLSIGSDWHWERRTVCALVGLGVVAALVGLIGDGSFATMVGRTYGPDAYYTYTYDWQANTLHHGMTDPGESPLISTKLNLGSLVVGSTSLALGVYGMIPDRWHSGSENPSQSTQHNPVR